MALYSDALTGSGGLGANWTVTSPANWQRTASGARQEEAGGAYRKAVYSGGAMDSDNYRVQATIAYDSDASIGHGVAGRWASGGTITCYGLIRFAAEVYFVEITAGAETQAVLLGAFGTGPLELRQEYDGSTIRSYVAGVLEDERSDASLASGSPGLIAYGGGPSATNYATNWTAEDLATVRRVMMLLGVG